MLTRVNLIVGTTNNYAPMTMSIRKAAKSSSPAGRSSRRMLNRIEMAFRLYDPCLSCATHALPGQMPLEVIVRLPEGEIISHLSR